MIPVYLNVYGPLDSGVLDQIVSLQFKGLRDGIAASVPSEIDRIVGDFTGSGRPLRPLILVGADDVPLETVVARAKYAVTSCSMQGVLDPAIEVINEPNNHVRYKSKPALYGQTVRAVYEALPKTVRVVAGGVMSTSKESLSYLRKAISYIPRECTVGFHSYRPGRPDDPLPGFFSRAAEFAELRSITESRPIWNTEIGWHTAKPTKKWYECKGKRVLTDDEVASNLRREIVVCEENGVEMLVVFQLNDGPNADYESHFGIRYLDGRWKPSSLVAQE